MKKICSNKNCFFLGIEQDVSNFYFRNDSKKHFNKCKKCCKQAREENKEIRNEYKKIYRKNNKDAIFLYKKSYKKNNENLVFEQRKKYRQNNKVKISSYNIKYHKERRLNDINFRLRHIISGSINKALKRNKSSKDGKSYFKYINYSIENLKEHLKNLFEPWMTWDNYGSHNSNTWDDKDQSTWTWHIDHIITHSNFKYTSMEDQSFKDCWELSNLRPYSAKQNIIDGNRK
jgi:hypothetical protein